MTGKRAARIGLVVSVVLAAVGLVMPSTASAGVIAATLVKTTNTNTWSHPSPDPSGITYNSRTDELIISDGEVEETGANYPKHVWKGTNLFYASRSGQQIATNRNTMRYSPEPTGVGFRPVKSTWTERLFVSDDDAARVFEVNARDGIYGNSDDSWTSFSVAFTNVGARADAEDVAVDLEVTRNGQLLIVDGKGKRVFVYSPGPNGAFDGQASAGGDDVIVRVINVGNLGAGDPEGVAYNPARNTVFVLDDPSNRLYEISLTGQLQNTVTLPIKMKSGAGLAFAPASASGPGGPVNAYIVDRGIDNDTNQDTFNDGKMYEFSIPGLGSGTPPSSNTAPTVDAGPNRSVTLPDAASLDGTVSDSTPTGTLTTTWTEDSGPGDVTFGNANSVDTTATFSAAGTYVLRLTADDGQASASDTTTVTVTEGGTTPPPTGSVLDSPVRAGADDAEENTGTGAVVLGSSDINLTRDGSVTMAVGLRFRSVALPAGATITNAWVQFQADEVQSVATDLTIRVQNSANAPAFTTATRNISSRATTAGSVSWSPAAWTAVGQRTAVQRTPNLASLLQPVMGGSGWASGNAVALIITGTGERTAESYNAGAALAPVLHIEYTR